MNPTCPQDYTCSFTLVHARTIYHTVGPWWQHTAGWIVAIVAIIALACVLIYGMILWSDLREKRTNRLEKARELQHELDMEEQRTLQADYAKGDPDMLKLIRQRI